MLWFAVATMSCWGNDMNVYMVTANNIGLVKPAQAYEICVTCGSLNWLRGLVLRLDFC